LKCNFNEAELRKFIRQVSENCPVDAKKLQKEIAEAEGKKTSIYQAIGRARLKTFPE